MPRKSYLENPGQEVRGTQAPREREALAAGGRLRSGWERLLQPEAGVQHAEQHCPGELLQGWKRSVAALFSTVATGHVRVLRGLRPLHLQVPSLQFRQPERENTRGRRHPH